MCTCVCHDCRGQKRAQTPRARATADPPKVLLGMKLRSCRRPAELLTTDLFFQSLYDHGYHSILEDTKNLDITSGDISQSPLVTVWGLEAWPRRDTI